MLCTQMDMAALLHRLPAQSSTDMSQSTNTIHPELNSGHGCKAQTQKGFRDPAPSDVL